MKGRPETYKRGGTDSRKISTLADVVDLIKQAEGRQSYKDVLRKEAESNPLLKSKLVMKGIQL